MYHQFAIRVILTITLAMSVQIGIAENAPNAPEPAASESRQDEGKATRSFQTDEELIAEVDKVAPPGITEEQRSALRATYLHAMHGEEPAAFEHDLRLLDEATLLAPGMVTFLFASAFGLDHHHQSSKDAGIISGRYIRLYRHAFVRQYLKSAHPEAHAEALYLFCLSTHIPAYVRDDKEALCESYLIRKEAVRYASPEILAKINQHFDPDLDSIEVECKQLGLESLEDVVSEKPRNTMADYTRIAYRLYGELPDDMRKIPPTMPLSYMAPLQQLKTPPSWEAIELALAQFYGVPGRVLASDLAAIDSDTLADPLMEIYVTGAIIPPDAKGRKEFQALIEQELKSRAAAATTPEGKHRFDKPIVDLLAIQAMRGDQAAEARLADFASTLDDETRARLKVDKYTKPKME